MNIFFFSCCFEHVNWFTSLRMWKMLPPFLSPPFRRNKVNWNKSLHEIQNAKSFSYENFVFWRATETLKWKDFWLFKFEYCKHVSISISLFSMWRWFFFSCVFPAYKMHFDRLWRMWTRAAFIESLSISRKHYKRKRGKESFGQSHGRFAQRQGFNQNQWIETIERVERCHRIESILRVNYKYLHESFMQRIKGLTTQHTVLFCVSHWPLDINKNPFLFVLPSHSSFYLLVSIWTENGNKKITLSPRPKQ